MNIYILYKLTHSSFDSTDVKKEIVGAFTSEYHARDYASSMSMFEDETEIEETHIIE